MRTVYWILTIGLIIVLMVYSVTKDHTSTCQPPQVVHRLLT